MALREKTGRTNRRRIDAFSLLIFSTIIFLNYSWHFTDSTYSSLCSPKHSLKKIEGKLLFKTNYLSLSFTKFNVISDFAPHKQSGSTTCLVSNVHLRRRCCKHTTDASICLIGYKRQRPLLSTYETEVSERKYFCLHFDMLSFIA